MTMLICSGTQFSGWELVCDQLMQTNSNHAAVCSELSVFSRRICLQHFSEADELDWRPFSPDEEYLDEAKRLLSPIDDLPVFVWASIDSNLMLNFWKLVDDSAVFILFFSSPEHELCRFIEIHGFDEKGIENVIEAWVARTRSMFTFFMNFRDSCLLVNAESVLSDSDMLIRNLRKKFNLDVDFESSTFSEQPEISSLVKYLATTLLLNNHNASEMYDDVRSAATIISESDKTSPELEERKMLLIDGFMKELSNYRRTADLYQKLEDKCNLQQAQVSQLKDALEFIYQKSNNQANLFSDYLSGDPLLKLARHARKQT
jgi:hypothetical protein